MPLYEYECEKDGHRFEVIQKFSDPPLTTCPDHAGVAVRKLISSPAIQFKGTGWYITDYARKGKNGDSAPSATKPASGSSPSSTGSSSSSATSSSDSSSGSTTSTPASSSSSSSSESKSDSKSDSKS